MNKHVFTDNEFAHLGEGESHMCARSVQTISPAASPRFRRLHRALNFWALFGASGEPIVLSDVRANRPAGRA